MLINYPSVLIVGESGEGKSYSPFNIPANELRIFNVEKKFPPYKKNKEHLDKTVWWDGNFQPYYDNILRCFKDPKSEPIIFIDSMGKLFDHALQWAASFNKGYDIYRVYNAKIFEFLEAVKDNQRKIIICTGHPELLSIMQDSGAMKNFRRYAVKGKEWEGKVEKEFSIVLFTEPKMLVPGQPIQYRFLTNTNGAISAKSPQGLLVDGMENDLWAVVTAIRSYYQLPKFDEPGGFLEQKV